jgi:hypothetical protein
VLTVQESRGSESETVEIGHHTLHPGYQPTNSLCCNSGVSVCVGRVTSFSSISSMLLLLSCSLLSIMGLLSCCVRFGSSKQPLLLCNSLLMMALVRDAGSKLHFLLHGCTTL